MKNKLIILILIALIALPALADLKAYPNSGGMNLPTFIDSKAEPVIGVGTSPDGKSKAELGGIYTLGPIGPGEKPPIYDFTEHGSVILDISKVGDQIVVKWKVNTVDWPELAGQLIDVYCMVGNGDGSYFPLYFWPPWKKVVKVENNIEIQVDPHPINIAPAGYQVAIFPKKEIEDWHGEIRVPKQVGLAEGQKEIYFKAKLSDPLLEGMDAFPKVATVGKVDKTVLANKYVFLSVPFQEMGVSLADQVLGSQLSNGSEFLWWDNAAQAYKAGTYSGGWIGSNVNLTFGQGFILRAKNDGVVTFIGKTGKVTVPVKGLDANKYDLISYPFPNTVAFNKLGISPSNGDELLMWDAAAQAYKAGTYSNGIWLGPAQVVNLTIAEPRFLRPKLGLSWDNNNIIFP